MKLFRSIASFYALFQISVFAYGQISSDSITAASRSGKGIVVERVSKNTQAEKAGVRPGDILLNWKRGDAKGEFESPFDLSHVFFEQAPRGPVTLNVVRGSERRTWSFGSDTWGISARPNFTGPFLAIYRRGQELFATGNPAEAAGRFRAAAAGVQDGDVSWLPSWLLSHAGNVLSGAQQWDLSDAVYREAIDWASHAGPTIRADLFRQWASGFEVRDDLANAEKYYQEALVEWQKQGRETMAEANTLLSLGVIELKRGDFEGAGEHLRHARVIGEKCAPTSIQTLLTLANLAVLYQDRGQLEKAEEYYLKALYNEEKHFPRSSHLARTLTDLGVLFDQQGDPERAEAYQQRALTIAEHLDSDSPDVADILAKLAESILEKGDPPRAEEYQKRALSIREKITPGGLSTAYSLAGLGKIARVRGDLAKAEEYYRRSLEIGAKLGAPAPDRASFLIGLAAVLRERRDFSTAAGLYRQVLAIIEKEDPGSMDRANTLADLAGTVYRQNQPDIAAQLYRQALSALENSAFHLGGAEEARSRYRAEHVRYYQEYMGLLLEQGHPEQAFELLEGSRARTLFEMLAQAHVDIAQGADVALRERERKLRQSLNAKSEYRMRLVNALHTDRQLAGIDTEIGDLLLQYQQVEAQLRASNPGYAALIQPRPLGVAEIQKLLDGNTLLLEYSLGEDRSYVWAVTDSSLAAYELPKGVEIEKAARRVYDLVTLRNRRTQAGGAAGPTKSEKEYLAAAQRLGRMVLGPVAQLLQGKRLLIVSDGALQYIPFSALPTPGSTNMEPLVVKHEIVNLPSASVLAELRRQRMGRPKAPRMVAVLADPVFDPNDERIRAAGETLASSFGSSAQQASDLTRSADDLGLTRNGRLYLNRLLYTRNEADAVIAVTPPGKGMAAVDFRASRALATSGALAQYRIVHFATHGILNNKHPELSGLVLSLVNKQGKAQDGFLKLQDIYNLKLPVDLVVLSGCETGLGEEIHGEGLIGLTRGFMYAGATRVVASLWNVSDMATASLMADFYKAMEHDGMRPAAALRTAQIQMWRHKQWNSPYYWAAFQIQGEWQ